MHGQHSLLVVIVNPCLAVSESAQTLEVVSISAAVFASRRQRH